MMLLMWEEGGNASNGGCPNGVNLSRRVTGQSSRREEQVRGWQALRDGKSTAQIQMGRLWTSCRQEHLLDYSASSTLERSGAVAESSTHTHWPSRPDMVQAPWTLRLDGLLLLQTGTMY